MVSKTDKLTICGYTREHEEVYNINVPMALKSLVALFYGKTPQYQSPPRHHSSLRQNIGFGSTYSPIEIRNVLSKRLNEVGTEITNTMKWMDPNNIFINQRNIIQESLRSISSDLNQSSYTLQNNGLSYNKNELFLSEYWSLLPSIRNDNISIILFEVNNMNDLFDTMGWKSVDILMGDIGKHLARNITKYKQYKCDLFHSQFSKNEYFVIINCIDQVFLNGFCDKILSGITSTFNINISRCFISIAENRGHPFCEYYHYLKTKNKYSKTTLSVSDNIAPNWCIATNANQPNINQIHRTPQTVINTNETGPAPQNNDDEFNEKYEFVNIGHKYTKAISSVFNDIFITYYSRKPTNRERERDPARHDFVKYKTLELGYIVNTFLMEHKCADCGSSIPLRKNKKIINKKTGEYVFEFYKNGKQLTSHSTKCIP